MISSSRSAAHQAPRVDHLTQAALPHTTAIGPPRSASVADLVVAMPQGGEARPLRVKFQYSVPPLTRTVPLERDEDLNHDFNASFNLEDKQGWSQTEVQTFIGGAIPVYCPQVWE